MIPRKFLTSFSSLCSIGMAAPFGIANDAAGGRVDIDDNNTVVAAQDLHFVERAALGAADLRADDAALIARVTL